MTGFTTLLRRLQHFSRSLLLCLIVGTIGLSSLTGCSLPQVSAEDRIFLNLSVDFLDEYRLPKIEFEGTPVGGLSGIAYDRPRNQFYAVSDDRSDLAPARFYTFKLILSSPEVTSEGGNALEPIGIEAVEIEKVTTLLDQAGTPYPTGTVDFEGIARAPQQTVFIASEGVSSQGIAPLIEEFDLETGQWQRQLPIPERYLPQTTEGQVSGVQDNLGFEALTINADGSTGNPLEPFRVFAATESALAQDLPSPETTTEGISLPIRIQHYLVGDDLPTLLAEHLYLAEPLPQDTERGGLSDLLTLDQAGHFLSLERSFALSTGFSAQIFQIATGGATDISGITSLGGNLTGIAPVQKRLLLDLSNLEIPLDNLEGMTLGPRLSDGTQSLVLLSDDNFNDLQTTQLLLFRLSR
ncbi:MAG: esterase-like activity of phytase family protein [Elainellaceae cyanobacterium]